MHSTVTQATVGGSEEGEQLFREVDSETTQSDSQAGSEDQGDSSSEDCGFEYLRRILDEHYKNKNETSHRSVATRT